MTTNHFARQLNNWYNKTARDLPWRETRDPYKIWISEIMLQQTTVAAVIPYYNKWIKRFPTVDEVARAKEQTILRLWQGLGYYSRARNIHKSAKIILNTFDGKIPCDSNELKKLPGFGPYTVGAVLSIAFDQRQPIIDANVRRVIMRLLAIKGLADTSHDQKILKHLDLIMPQKNLRTFNQAMMELGALICRSKEPLCTICPVRSYCTASAKGIQELIPEPKMRTLKNVDVAIGVIQYKGKYLIQKRPNKGLFAGLWEFPGGKIKKGESSKKAVIREIKEETELDVSNCKHLLNVSHFYTQFKANLHVFSCDSPQSIPNRNNLKLCTIKELEKYPMPSGSAKILDFLSK